MVNSWTSEIEHARLRALHLKYAVAHLGDPPVLVLFHDEAALPRGGILMEERVCDHLRELPAALATLAGVLGRMADLLERIEKRDQRRREKKKARKARKRERPVGGHAAGGLRHGQ